MIEVYPHVKKKIARIFILAGLVIAALIVLFAAGFAPLRAQGKEKPPHEYYIPLVVHPNPPVVKTENAISLVNKMRAEADIPLVDDSDPLNNNCFEHARYMAENDVLAHEQDPDLPYSSESGQDCAENANAWLGHGTEEDGWTPRDSVEVWMSSVGHRLWLLYPTTRTVGYGFFSTDEENRAAAALDVLSSANFDADLKYGGWPIQYPTGDVVVPSMRYPITINWRYFGPQPELKSTRLQTESGRTIAHKANTDLPAGHKGIQIIPDQDLPPHSRIIVTVSGNYEGHPFNHTWDFRTGD